jgi:hypothetical protein
MSSNLRRDTRHILLARALHARLYIDCEGRTFAVGGKIAHDQLAHALARQDQRPMAAQAPSAVNLGIASCDGELSQHLLHCIGRALNRWQKHIDAERLRRPARRRRSTHIAREQSELEKLKSRLNGVREWRALLAVGTEPQGAPYFLDAVAEANLHAALQNAGRQFPPVVAWQARVVHWLSGECAMRRFVSAVANLFAAYPDISCRESIRGFQQALIVWKRRCAHEPVRNLLKEISHRIHRLPPKVVREAQLSVRLHGRSFVEQCDVLVERCTQLLRKNESYRRQLLPAALAALAAADGSAVPLTGQFLRASAQRGEFTRLQQSIRRLARQIGRPGYYALLEALDDLPETAAEIDYGDLCELLGKRTSATDAVWACQEGLADPLKGSCLSATAARRLSESFEHRGCSLDKSDLWRLVNCLRQIEDVKPISAWLKWLGSVPPRAITPRIRRLLMRSLWRYYLPSVRRHGWFQQLAPVLAPLHRGTNADGAEELLQSIATYRRLAGQQEGLPKSLRKRVEFDESRRRERDHLRSRLAAGTLHGRAALRLRHLETEELAPIDASRIRRTAEELFVVLGLDAMNSVARRLAEVKCRQRLGNVATTLSFDQLWDFALWTESMTDLQQKRLSELIEAQTRHGADYKVRLAGNLEWISRATARGLNLEPWFAADDHVETIGNKMTEIGVATDLHHIFLMGAYFHTCLAPGDCNEMSVLVNAYDANKQVLFMLTRDNEGRKRVVARQLIAVSSDFRLVRYECYTKPPFADKTTLPVVLDAMAAFSGRLAARCGFELADQGSPEVIADRCWYDDGECKWPSAAHAAWAQTNVMDTLGLRPGENARTRCHSASLQL